MSRFKHPPIERHDSLKPLSRDHYQGLVKAQRLITSAEGDAAARRAALAEFIDAWSQEIAAHFEDEERLLMAHLDASQQERLAREHRALRDLAAQARSRRRQVDPGPVFVRHLGATLRDHIRWEERELFPAVEEVADAAALERIGAETAAIEARRPRACPR